MESHLEGYIPPGVKGIAQVCEIKVVDHPKGQAVVMTAEVLTPYDYRGFQIEYIEPMYDTSTKTCAEHMTGLIIQLRMLHPVTSEKIVNNIDEVMMAIEQARVPFNYRTWKPSLSDNVLVIWGEKTDMPSGVNDETI
jgi:hypothetical protein